MKPLYIQEHQLKLLSALFTLATCFSTKSFSCDLSGLDVSELSSHKRFQVSSEIDVKISTEIFWANQAFFVNYKSKNCRGAFRSASFYDKLGKTAYRYFRTDNDSCDGGNTYGFIILENSNSKAAVAQIQDGEIHCN